MFKHILLKIDREGFEYDAAALFKSFCADCAIYIETPETAFPCGAQSFDGEPDLIIDVHLISGEMSDRISINASVRDGLDSVPEYGSYADVKPAELNDVKSSKNILKRMIYDAMKHITGKELPWGTLTGIRPAKIVTSLPDADYGYIYTHMKENYYVSDKKIKLAVEIAGYEKEILEGTDYKGAYSLYTGIPFCPTTCLYCSFTSFPMAVYEKMADDYLDALCLEIEYAGKKFADRTLNTVYVGGGTPTALSEHRLERLLKKIRQSFDFEKVSEFTVEAGRADSISGTKLDIIKKYGADRISVNPQTMKQETLDLIGRRHTTADVKNAFRLAREYGFDNINMDLIAGLPGEDEDDIKNTLEEIKKLSPDSLTIHSLALKRAAALNIYRDRYASVTMENNNDIMNIVDEYARGLEMRPYYIYRQKNMAGNLENVGYARTGKAGIYNVLSMEEVQDIVALGAGSISKRVYPDGRIERSANVKELAQYIGRIEEMIERKDVLFNT